MYSAYRTSILKTNRFCFFFVKTVSFFPLPLPPHWPVRRRALCGARCIYRRVGPTRTSVDGRGASKEVYTSVAARRDDDYRHNGGELGRNGMTTFDPAEMRPPHLPPLPGEPFSAVQRFN